MRKVIIITFTLLGINVFSQNSVKFSHDASGNLTQRYIQVVNLRLAKKELNQDSVLNFKVYPNPAKEQITIEGPLDSEVSEAPVLLYNINGSLVKQFSYNGTKKSFPLTGLTTGVYFLEVKHTEKQSSNYRIVITE